MKGLVAILLLALCMQSYAKAPACDPAVFEDLRTKVADCQKAHHALRTDLQILAERIDTHKLPHQETSLSSESTKLLLDRLEAKIAALENQHSLIATDLRQLNTRLTSQIEQNTQLRQEIANIDERLSLHSGACKTALENVVKLHHSAHENSTHSYVVKNGDTLGEIAKRHGLSLKALKEANQMDNDRIFVGQTLSIPK